MQGFICWLIGTVLGVFLGYIVVKQHERGKKRFTESQKCEHHFEWQQIKFTGLGINPNRPLLTCIKCGQVRDNLPPSTRGSLLLVDVLPIKVESQGCENISPLDDICVVDIDSNSVEFDEIKTKAKKDQAEVFFSEKYDEAKDVSKSICENCGKSLDKKVKK